VTVGFLLIAALVDPLMAQIVSTDQFRPSTDYYVCRSKGTTDGILTFITVGHIVMSLVCVSMVWNGVEAFRDGSIMKEAFIILFACIAIAFTMSQLPLSQNNVYILRTALIGFGFTLFVLRILYDRCISHWLPQVVQSMITHYYNKFLSLFPSIEISNAKIAAFEKYADGVEISEYSQSSSKKVDSLDQDREMKEMMDVFKDEIRTKLFREVAVKGFLAENVDFLLAVNNFSHDCSIALRDSSHLCNPSIKKVSEDIFCKYINERSKHEVNISSATRNICRDRLVEWPMDRPTISEHIALQAIQSDIFASGTIFDPAVREIRLMLFQNIWQNFKAAEAQALMGETE